MCCLGHLLAFSLVIDVRLRKVAHNRLNLVTHSIVDFKAWTRHYI